MSDWISVDDEMPEEEGVYLCHFDDGTIETYDCEVMFDFLDIPKMEFLQVKCGHKKVNVTHWMPLPDAPI